MKGDLVIEVIIYLGMLFGAALYLSNTIYLVIFMFDDSGRTEKNLLECSAEIKKRGGNPIIVQMDHANDAGKVEHSIVQMDHANDAGTVEHSIVQMDHANDAGTVEHSIVQMDHANDAGTVDHSIVQMDHAKC